MFTRKAYRPSSLWATKILQIFIFYCGKLFFRQARVEVRGMEHVKNFQGNALFAANHASELDPIVLCLALERAGILRSRLPLIFLSREKAFYSDMGFVKSALYGGFLFRLLGAYPVVPRNARPAKDAGRHTLEMHLALLKDGYSVIIFPEGTRTQTGALLSAKAGVAILSEEAERPIIPIAIDGTFGLSFDDFWSGEKQVRVSFGAPMTHFWKKRVYIRKARGVMHAIEKILHSAQSAK